MKYMAQRVKGRGTRRRSKAPRRRLFDLTSSYCRLAAILASRCRRLTMLVRQRLETPDEQLGRERATATTSHPLRSLREQLGCGRATATTSHPLRSLREQLGCGRAMATTSCPLRSSRWLHMPRPGDADEDAREEGRAPRPESGARAGCREGAGGRTLILIAIVTTAIIGSIITIDIDITSDNGAGACIGHVGHPHRRHPPRLCRPGTRSIARSRRSATPRSTWRSA